MTEQERAVLATWLDQEELDAIEKDGGFDTEEGRWKIMRCMITGWAGYELVDQQRAFRDVVDDMSRAIAISLVCLAQLARQAYGSPHSIQSLVKNALEGAMLHAVEVEGEFTAATPPSENRVN